MTPNASIVFIVRIVCFLQLLPDELICECRTQSVVKVFVRFGLRGIGESIERRRAREAQGREVDRGKPDAGIDRYSELAGALRGKIDRNRRADALLTTRIQARECRVGRGN